MGNSVRPDILMLLNSMVWFHSHRTPLARGILANGWTLDLAAPGAEKDPQLQQISHNNRQITSHDLAPVSSSLNPFFHLRQIAGNCAVIKNLQPKIIHALGMRHVFYTGLALRILRSKTPAIYTLAGLGSLFTGHGARFKVMRILAMPLLRFALSRSQNIIIVQNPDDKKILIDRKMANPAQIVLIRSSGVDLQEFLATKEPESENPIILFASRLLREKGILDFIQAARILKKRNEKARFLVAGEIYPDNPNSLSEHEMQEFHAQNIIEYLGVCNDISGLIKKSAIVVLPSYYGEGVPKILLEAAASSRAVITCDMPGCREAVLDQKSGILIPPKSPEHLSNAIQKLLQNKDIRFEMGKRGRAYMKEYFDVRDVTRKTLDIYEKLLT